MSKKVLEELVARPYRIKLYPVSEEDGQVEWVAEIPDLPGCVGCGDTPEEALEMVSDAKKAWIEIALTDGKRVPEPTNPDSVEYSGKFTLRIPKNLHKELTIASYDQGLSLNQYLLYLVTKNHYMEHNKDSEIK
jgi:predicted RNase H-like HicB family nuclease